MYIKNIELVKQPNDRGHSSRRQGSYMVYMFIALQDHDNIELIKRIVQNDNCAYHWEFHAGVALLKFVGDIGNESIDGLFSRFGQKLNEIAQLAT